MQLYGRWLRPTVAVVAYSEISDRVLRPPSEEKSDIDRLASGSSMSGPPTGATVHCPECDESTIAIVPESTEVIEDQEGADGGVRATCPNCGEVFTVYFQSD